ncbi:rhomboid family intramembrane serine protease [Tsukamurella sp. 8F]|uniref:rhomboid family intramembrane serine protease n=1 Tax=unclassified Tsukamurella TaxID=2633480 RepID=UPI0023B951D7|nr:MULTISPECIES: rhomboid family intramembrane serine protease [unclassified Tsukamurella]MDF0528634.1 rhomboid family intramembrane serine protease [Tsukamurella sp. 8J]MDF0585596.1 rhomboid family intramembrane serine protease [Tsukamurella sp. 8F]
MIDTPRTTRTWRPVLTYALIAANVIAYLWSASKSGSIVDNQASEAFAKLCLSLPATSEGWWWTAVTSGFLHFGRSTC